MLKKPDTPPMGWNSWDCYGAAVNEEQVRANARYMAENLKEYGWEYVVVDIQWYESTADGSRMHAFMPLCMDGYSRLIPAENRFPSAAGGKGFAPLAEYVHSLGLKFGIHIMRGIPRQAVHANTPVLGSELGARHAAKYASICPWCTDNYGVDPLSPNGQAYYDSIFQLYAQWGVDYVKVDDIAYNAWEKEGLVEDEIVMIHKAIDRCGRDMVLSLSPGPAPLSHADTLCRHATMWRITADLWDSWDDIVEDMDRCAQWAPYVGQGNWPDADMLPLGHLSLIGSEHGIGERMTRLSRDEQVTMMTLWCLCRSPLMFGGEMRDNDAFTLSLLTNREVLALLSHSSGARRTIRNDNFQVWQAKGENGTYVALFNVSTIPRRIGVPLYHLGLEGTYRVYDLWEKKEIGTVEDIWQDELRNHQCRLLKLTKEA